MMDILKMIQRQNQLIQELKALPKGRLVYHGPRNACWQCYCKEQKRQIQIYIRQRDLPAAEKVFRQKILLEKELKDIQAHFKTCPEEVQRTLAQMRRDEEEHMLASRKYHGDQYRHHTLRGEYVASKSEVLLADYLYLLHIPYQYEQSLRLGRSTYYPDFTLYVHGAVIYLEHFGLMEDPSYQINQNAKLAIYRNYGIIEGFNLICTSEDHGAIDMQAIDRIFRQWGIIGKDWDAIAERDQRRIRQRREKAREKSQDT